MKKSILALTLILFSSGAIAHGSHVKEPQIHQGEFEIHNTASFSFDDDDSFSNELELEYGFTKWFKAEIGFVSENEEGEPFNWIEATEIGVQFKLADECEYQPITSIHFSYDIGTDAGDNPDKFAVMGLFGKQIGQFNNILNLKLSKQSGENAEGGLEFDAAFRSAYEFSHDLALGAEYFGEFGQFDDMPEWDHQGHQLGPILMFEPLEDTHASIGYLVGISDDAADGTIKLELGFEL